MLFFGHIGITAFLGKFLYLPLLFVVIGSMLPDALDKGLVLIGITDYSRFVAHNIFFGPMAGMITYAVTRRRDASLAILFGCYMHLIEDSNRFLPWLYPLVRYELIPVQGINIMLGTYEYVSEAIGLSLLIILFRFKSNVIAIRERILSNIKDSYDRRIVKKVRK